MSLTVASNGLCFFTWGCRVYQVDVIFRDRGDLPLGEEDHLNGLEDEEMQQGQRWMNPACWILTK